MSEDQQSNSTDFQDDHWSYSNNKTLIVVVHASIFIPIVGFFFIGFPWWVLPLWLGVDFFLSKTGMEFTALLKRACIKIGSYFHKGYRVRKDKLTLLKYRRDYYGGK